MSSELTYRSTRTRPTIDDVIRKLGAFSGHLFSVASTTSTTGRPSHFPAGTPDILDRHTYSVPIKKYISLRIFFTDTYDNTPDPAAQRNEAKTIVALSFAF